MKTTQLKGVIDDRELQITQYNAILNIVLNNTDIDYSEIKWHISQEFNSDYLSSEQSNATRRVILKPKNPEINNGIIWDYMGAFELVLTNEDVIRSISNYKP
jgi:hypothetical protein